MGDDQLKDLSRRERQIVEILFRLGEASVAEVRDAMTDPPSYSSVRALLRILEEKGRLQHRQDGPRYLYEPRIARERTRRSVLKGLLDNFFGGSREQLVAALLDEADDSIDEAELTRLGALIERARKEGELMPASPGGAIAVILERWGLLMPELTLAGAFLLAGVGLIALLARRASASTRHWLWTLGILATLALPLLDLLLPPWAGPVSMAPVAVAEPGAPPPAFLAGWSGLALFALWLTGALAVGGGIVRGAWRMRRLVARASALPAAEWDERLRGLMRALGLKRRVRLLRSAELRVPVCHGIFRPVVLLPADCETWDPALQHDVLHHELAHVKRQDCLTHALARLACGLYWFNPLLWLAASRMRQERERACDDFVLLTGVKPSAYGENLLGMARRLAARRRAWEPGLAMAQGPQLGGRLRDLLDAGRRRRGTDWLAGLGLLALVALIAIPLAAFDPGVAAAGGVRLSGPPEVLKAIVRENRRLEKAYARGDLAGVAEVYTRDARSYPRGTDVRAGREAIADLVGEFRGLGANRVRLRTRELVVREDTAYEVGEFAYAWLWRFELLKGRYLCVWKFEDGRWRLHRDIGTI